MKKLLITGANGFLGSRLAVHFNEKYDVFTPSHAEMDICNMEKLSDFFDAKRPDIVIHCAAISDTRVCEEHEQEAYNINVLGASFVAKSCKNYNSKLIFCSSDQIYNGNSGGSSHRETDFVSPKTVYAKQKLEAENYCLDICPETVCLRLSWMYDTKSICPKEHSDLFRTVVSAIKNSDSLSYPINDCRGVTYVASIVDSIEKTFNLQSGVYNFGSENLKMMNTYELVRNLLAYLNTTDSILTKNETAFADSPRNLCMNLDKIKSFGINLPSTLDGLKNTARTMIK